MAAKVRNALTLYRPLSERGNVEIRLQRTVAYNSIYRADGQLIVNQHAHGIPAAQSPVYCLRQSEGGESSAYLEASRRSGRRPNQHEADGTAKLCRRLLGLQEDSFHHVFTNESSP
jgi:hypothetical protein